MKNQNNTQELFQYAVGALQSELSSSPDSLESHKGSVPKTHSNPSEIAGLKAKSTPPGIKVDIHNRDHYAQIRNARSISDTSFLAELKKPLQILGKLGKSGSLLAFTASQYYIVKVIPSKEANHLIQIIPEIVKHVSKNQGKGMYTCQPVCLCQVTIKHLRVYREKVFFVIQESCYPRFPTSSMKPILFDIKGSFIARTTKIKASTNTIQTLLTINNDSNTTLRGSALDNNNETNASHASDFPPRGIILKDNNLSALMQENPRWMDFHTNQECDTKGSNKLDSARQITHTNSPNEVFEALREDVELLIRLKCLDYSLLLVMIPVSFTKITNEKCNKDKEKTFKSVGAPPLHVKINHVPHLAYLRIIDTLCPWSFQKHIALFAKVWIRRMPRSGLSTMPPELYGKRFLDTCERLLMNSEGSKIRNQKLQ